MQITEIDFDIFLTGCSGIIYPPDILNIDDSYIPIIEETKTCDDITLKYFEIKKGVPSKWIKNKNYLAPPIYVPNTQSNPLSAINGIFNNVCIDKLNLNIQKLTLNNLCIPYKNIQTGMSIYLFDIYNKKKINNKLFFNINAYSYCPIDMKLEFNISFDNSEAYCFLNESNFFFTENTDKIINKKIASCFTNEININLDYDYPNVISENNIIIKIFNYRKHLTTIFKNFICQDTNNCILKVILLKKIKYNSIPLFIANKNYICKLSSNDELIKENYPIIKDFKCLISNTLYNNDEVYFSGLPLDMSNMEKMNNNKIPNQFIISRIVTESEGFDKKIIIIGTTDKNFENDSYDFYINFINPKATLKCNLKSYSKYVQSKFYCENNKEIEKEIFVENQIIYSFDFKYDLLLINQETFIKISNSYNSDEIKNEEKYYMFIKKDNNNFLLLLICFFIIIFIKILSRVNLIKFKFKKKIKRRYKRRKKIQKKNYCFIKLFPFLFSFYN